MIYFCADDYGISRSSNARIEECFKNGVLNKISVLPNGDLSDFNERLLSENIKLSLHLNLVEGCPLSKKEDVSLLVSEKGFFKYSFIGLFFLSLFGNRRLLEKQLYNEIKAQIDFWENKMGEKTPILIDSHQHTHMIPSVFKALVKVLKEENIKVDYLRIPAEPLMPFIKTPSLYFTYSLVNIIKQWLLNLLWLIDKKELKDFNIPTALFFGILFSGEMDQKRVAKILPQYIKLANKTSRDIEVLFHPGYLEENETDFKNKNIVFKDFYLSKNRKTEFDSVMELVERSVT